VSRHRPRVIDFVVARAGARLAVAVVLLVYTTMDKLVTACPAGVWRWFSMQGRNNDDIGMSTSAWCYQTTLG